MISCTGWTWEQVGRLTLPRLRALYAHWRHHPPTHRLVAAYLGYEAPIEATRIKPSTGRSAVPIEDDAAPAPARTAWMQGMGSVPASAALRGATTAEEALAAAERMFFGELIAI